MPLNKETKPSQRGDSLCSVVVIYKAFCLDIAQGHMNAVSSETQTHLWRFASLAC